MHCRICGRGVSDARPRYRIKLVASDSLSTSFADSEVGTDEQICRECWRDVQRDLH